VKVIPPLVTTNPSIAWAGTSDIVSVTVAAMAVEAHASTNSSLFILPIFYTALRIQGHCWLIKNR
jgi:hypothetical protein